MSRRLLLVLLCAANLSVSAQSIPPQAAATVSTAPARLAWTLLRGTAADLSVGSDGTAFSLDPEGRVWMRRAGLHSSWLNLPGQFKRIDTANEKDAWAIDAEGTPFRYNGTFWRRMTGIQAVDTGVGAGGTAYFATVDGKLVRRDPNLGFIPVPGSPAGVTRVDVDDREQPWVVLGDASIQRFDGRNWRKLPGSALDISAGSRNGAFMAGTNRQPARWNHALGSWEPLLALANLVAAGPDNKPWIVTPEGLIFANDPAARQRTSHVAVQPGAFIQTIGWRRVQGKAKSLAISARGQIMALGTEGEVWQWKGKGNWQRIPGSFDRIALGPSGMPIAIAADGQIFTLRGNQWVEIPGRAKDVSITPQGVAWILRPDGSPAYWNPPSGWVSLNEPGDAVRLVVGAANTPWTLTREGLVRFYDGKNWVKVDGVTAADIAIGPEGTVFVIGRDKKISRFDVNRKRWEQVTPVAGDAVAVAVGPNDKPWVINNSADIYASSLFDEPEIPGGACSNPVGSKLPDVRQADIRQIRNSAARDIAIGKDGNVMITDATSNLAQWRNLTQSFKPFPGQMLRVAVAPNGNPWGITPSGAVWRHDGSKWEVIRNNFIARDIAIGCNGTVIVSASDESMYRFAPKSGAFEKLVGARADDPAPKGRKVAVDPQGNPWTISGDWVYRCDVLPCERQAIRAKDIAIGPEGTLMVADLEGNLQAFNGIDNRWERIGISADAVAVGPGGKPWILRNGTEVWYSALFTRQEEKDDEKAAGTRAIAVNIDTSNSTSLPFTFTTSMIFDEVKSFVNGIETPIDSQGLAVGPSGKVILLHEVAPAIVKYLVFDPNTKRFVDTNIPSPSTTFSANGVAIGPGDTLYTWLNPSIGIGRDGHLWVLKNNVWQTVAGPGLLNQRGLTGLGINESASVTTRFIDLAFAPDGTLTVLSPERAIDQEISKILRYNAVTRQFSRNTLQLSADADAMTIDPSGVIWMIRSSDGRPVQSVGNAFLERPVPTTICKRAGCLAAGASGAIYVIDTGSTPDTLLRWNALNNAWDKVTIRLANGNPPSDVARLIVTPDGRPWFYDADSLKVWRAR